MSEIQAIVAVTPGHPAIIKRPYPTLPLADYILVCPTAWAINPADAYYSTLEGQDGCQLGADFAGVVLEVGSGVTKDLKVGDRVAGALNGGYDDQVEAL
jgi:NADPH:quinone reductase-like Zn-dependent oxidoreductase